MSALPTYIENIRKYYQDLPIPQREAWLATLDEDVLEETFYWPEIFLSDIQIPPDGEWRYFMLRAGRGLGKTFASTSWLYGKIMRGAKEVGIMGPDYKTLINEIVPTLMNHFAPGHEPEFKRDLAILQCKKTKEGGNGCVIKLYTSEQEVRGANLEYAVAEEICKWCDSQPDKVQEKFDIFDFAVRNNRAKPHPQIFISSTPKGWKFFTNFDKKVRGKDPDYAQKVGSTNDNPHLSDAAKKAFYKKYGGTRLGRQELMGDILEDVEGALWTQDMITKAHTVSKERFLRRLELGELVLKRIVVGVDPAVTSNEKSDETGIVLVALGDDNHLYVMDDRSGVYSPFQWADLVNKMYKRAEASLVVVEKNNGGDLVELNLRTVNKFINIKAIHASKGKMVRAEPVAALYEQGLVHHLQEFDELEYQLTHFNGDSTETSPDRLDALCWAIHELVIQNETVVRYFGNMGNY